VQPWRGVTVHSRHEQKQPEARSPTVDNRVYATDDQYYVAAAQRRKLRMLVRGIYT